MKLRDVIGLYVGMQTLTNKVLPVKLSYCIAYNTEVLEKEAKRVDQQKSQLIERYANKDENGKPVIEQLNGQPVYSFGENQEVFFREYNDFLDTEVELDIRTINEEIIEKCDEPKYDALSTGDLSNLLFMID